MTDRAEERDERDGKTTRPEPSARDARRADALRANLHRRKAQARARADRRDGNPDSTD